MPKVKAGDLVLEVNRVVVSASTVDKVSRGSSVLNSEFVINTKSTVRSNKCGFLSSPLTPRHFNFSQLL